MQLLTENKASEILNCTTAALHRWRREGRGPDFIKIGRLVRYRESDLMEFIDTNTRKIVQEKAEGKRGDDCYSRGEKQSSSPNLTADL